MALLAALVMTVPLLTAATSGPAAGDVRVEEQYTLTVKLLDHAGQVPCDDCLWPVEVYNDTWEEWQGGRDDEAYLVWVRR